MKNILVIDDDIIIGRLIGKIARRNAIDITVARSAKEAKRVLHSKKRFDAIFLDLIIPDISGWDILTAIKKDPSIKHIPVIILTGALLSKGETDKLRKRVFAILDKRTFETEQIEIILKGGEANTT